MSRKKMRNLKKDITYGKLWSECGHRVHQKDKNREKSENGDGIRDGFY